MQIREVKTFAWHGWVSGHLERHERAQVLRMMQADLEYRCRDQGYEPLPDTFGCRFIRAGDDDVFMLPGEEQEFMETRDVVWARTWLRCFSIEGAA
jgi:hypothetical protein